MAKKRRQLDPIGRYQRKATAARRIGRNKQCACGESRPEALVRGSKPTTCAACVRKKRGLTTEDNHHPAGRANNPATIRVPVNDHRAELSPAQYDWPRETLENPDRSPLLTVCRLHPRLCRYKRCPSRETAVSECRADGSAQRFSG